jgi:hypothetical protein
MSAMPRRSAFADVCTDLLLDGRAVRFRASGWSMEPAIRDGDVITVTPARPGEVGLGDVVLYLAERGPTAHRVVALVPGETPAIRVRGDASGPQDEFVPMTRLLGRVAAVEARERKALVARCFERLGRLLPARP